MYGILYNEKYWLKNSLKITEVLSIKIIKICLYLEARKYDVGA